VKSVRPSSLRPYLTRHKEAIAVTVVCCVVTVSFNLLLPAILRRGIDGLTAGTLSAGGMAGYAGAYMGAVMLSLVFSWAMRWFPLRVGERVVFDIRQDLFDRFTRMDQDFFRRERTGDLMTRMISDLGLVRDFVGQGILNGIRSLIVVVMAFGGMAITSPVLAGWMAILFPAMIGTFYVFIRLVRHRSEEVQEQFSELTRFTQETYAGIRSVKCFALEERRLVLFGRLNRELIRRNMRLSFARQPMWPLFAFWFSLGIMLILWVGGRQVIMGRLTLGGLDFDRVGVEVEGRPLLADINLHIPAGVTVGITGPTGSGKTLLVSLVSRILDPSAGVVKVDGIPLRELPLRHLRAHVGFAAQEPVLFSQTLAGRPVRVRVPLRPGGADRVDRAAHHPRYARGRLPQDAAALALVLR
jgi:ATP-binding cassette subfamily B protein